MERLYCLVIVVSDTQKLIVIIIQAGIKVIRNSVPRDRFECSVEQFADYKPR